VCGPEKDLTSFFSIPLLSKDEIVKLEQLRNSPFVFKNDFWRIGPPGQTLLQLVQSQGFFQGDWE
jgi:hypothetical protein